MPHPLPYFLPSFLPGPLEDADAPPRIPGTLTPDEIDEVEDLILSEYLESPRLLALVRAYRNAIAARDATAVSIYEDALDIDRAEGDGLDRIGRILGEPRDDRDDAAFRRGLRVAVLVNRSSGFVPEIARIARLHESADEDPDAQIRVREPAGRRVIVYVDASPSTPLRRVHGYLRDAKAAGVNLQTVQVQAPFSRAQGFRLVTPDLAGTRDVYGLADIASNVGGALAHVLDS